MNKIFISHRRDDAAAEAQLLHRALADEFGEKSVFLDVDGMGLAEDWKVRIRREVAASSVVVVLMGKDWRLTEAIQLELQTAEDHDIPRLPVLLEGADIVALTAKLDEPFRSLGTLHAARYDIGRGQADLTPILKTLRSLTGGSTEPRLGRLRKPPAPSRVGLYLAGALLVGALVVAVLSLLDGGGDETDPDTDSVPTTANSLVELVEGEESPAEVIQGCDPVTFAEEARRVIAERDMEGDVRWEDGDQDCLHSNFEKNSSGTDPDDGSDPLRCDGCPPNSLEEQLPYLYSSECDLVKAAKGENLAGHQAFGCVLEDNDLDGANFIEADLRGLSVSSGTHSLVVFQSANLQRSVFSGGNWNSTDFSFADLTHASFEDLDLSNVNFDQADLTGTVFRNYECKSGAVDWGDPRGVPLLVEPLDPACGLPPE